MKIVRSKNLPKDFFDYFEREESDRVKNILSDIKLNGDVAVNKYAREFDGMTSGVFKISRAEIAAAYAKAGKKNIAAIKAAAKNIRLFAQKQFAGFKNFEINNNGTKLGQLIVPLERVGCYVPGGRYPLPSSALMGVIPAKVAGIKEIIVCSPKISPLTIVAADIAGADKIFNVGGVQAIGAMAYGTKNIPKVDKIVGPGNKYVTAAKKEVYGIVGIDFIAGPSEVMIIADETGNVKFIAADMLAQAEHDPAARADLLTTSAKLAAEVNAELTVQLDNLKTKEVAKISLANGKIIIVQNLVEAAAISNRRAPEHLELQLRNPRALMKKLNNYGSLFIGNYSAEALGDYCSGTNHTLPTNGTAHYTGGLSVKEFIKVLTYQETTKAGCQKLAKLAAGLAELEGLDGHKKAAEIRLNNQTSL